MDSHSGIKNELTLMVGKSCFATLGSANSFGIRVCALTSKGRSVCYFGITGDGCCTWLFHIKQKYCIHQHAFLCSNIQHSTFHQTNYCSRPQTIRWFIQSDRKSVGLPIRLKELRTFACFPLSQHSRFYFPPFAKANGPPFLSRTGNVLHAFLCYIDRLEVCGWRVDKERFYKRAICNILLLSLIPT